MSLTRSRRAPSRPAASPGRREPVDVTVVTAQHCLLCEDALEELGRRHGEISLGVFPMDTPTGQELVRRHRPVMFPLVLVDGAFLSSGRLPRRKLDKVLAARRQAGARS
jgi:hypothetical protein